MVNDIGSNDIAHVHVRLCEESERRAEFCKRSAVGWAGWRRAQQKGSVNGSTDTLTLFNNFPLLLIYTHLSTRFISSTEHDSPRTLYRCSRISWAEVTMWPYRVEQLRNIWVVSSSISDFEEQFETRWVGYSWKIYHRHTAFRFNRFMILRNSSVDQILDELFLRMKMFPAPLTHLHVTAT